MRRKNGTTIVEVLVSILIITIVLVLLFSMLIQIRNEEVTNNIQSNFLLNQATFIKTIEEDAINYGVREVRTCTLSEANIPNNYVSSENRDNYKCIKLIYDMDYSYDNIGFLLVYHTYEKYDYVAGEYQGISDTASWMVQYVRGHYEYDNGGVKVGNAGYNMYDVNVTTWKPLTQTMRSLATDINNKYVPYLIYTAAPSSSMGGGFKTYNAGNIIVPIVDDNNEHYDISIAFTFDGNDRFKCDTRNSNLLSCNCKSNETLCEATYIR